VKLPLPAGGGGMLTITDAEFRRLADYIKKNYGIYLKDSKKALVAGRLNNLLVNKNFDNFTDYIDYLLADKTGTAITELINKITTNHTFFMREADHFYYFRDQVLPYWVRNIPDKDLRTWCAACSTGEEAYTLAMIIDQFFGPSMKEWDTKILATDISRQVLETAQRGIYSGERIAPLPAAWKANYFRRIDADNYIISDKIRNNVIFRRLNLVAPVFPFKRKLHVIFCRNVMIYFDNKTKEELVSKFYEHLEYGGYLFIGHSETIDRETTKFQYIKPAVYRKI
jgi:chemotaxis protein methyltransferase CheR